MNMLRQEIETGIHIRPDEYPFFIADAYFHTSEEIMDEFCSNGFEIINYHAVEGSIWITPGLDKKWQYPDSRNRMLYILMQPNMKNP